jgi:hypothetical protein
MIAVVLVVVMAFVGGMVWQRQASHVSTQQQQGMEDPAAGMPQGGVVVEPPADVHPGVKWTMPKRWTDAGPRSMRVATYTIPVAGDDVEAGECAVFYFGPSQGGGVDDNIARWVGQFENASSPMRSTKDVGKLKVHRVEVKGDYLAPSGPMMQSTGTKKGFMLLGAIVEGPNGGVFFKTTGPEKTIAAAANEFDLMLETIKPE